MPTAKNQHVGRGGQNKAASATGTRDVKGREKQEHKLEEELIAVAVQTHR